MLLDSTTHKTTITKTMFATGKLIIVKVLLLLLLLITNITITLMLLAVKEEGGKEGQRGFGAPQEGSRHGT